MQFIISLLLCLSYFQLVQSYSYIEALDTIIDEKIAIITKSAGKVDKVAYKIRRNLEAQVSLQEVEDFLDVRHSLATSFCNQVVVRNQQGQVSIDPVQLQAYQDLEFALGAKLYLHYIECVKQKMFYQAVKNYDALHYWENEKFYQSQSFFQKSIFRSLSGSAYNEQVKDHIALLKHVTAQTDSLLGLMLHGQQIFAKAQNEQDYKACLQQIVAQQNELLHAQTTAVDCNDMVSMIQTSMQQFTTFNMQLSMQYGLCQMPSHVVRHWKGYTATTIGVCAAAFIYLKYGQDIVHNAQGFFNQHVKDALNRNYEMLAGRMKAPQISTTQEDHVIDHLIEKSLTTDVIESPELEAALELKFGTGLQEYLQNGGSIEKYFEDNPNLIWIDTIANASWFGPINSEKYQKGSRSWMTSAYNWYNRIDSRKPLQYDPYWKNSDGSDGLPAWFWKYCHGVTDEDVAIANAYQKTVTDLAERRAAIRDNLVKLSQDGLCKDKDQLFDLTTPEGKKAYAEHHYRVVTNYPLSNIGRLIDLGKWTVATQSKSAKDVANTHSQDVHAMLGLTTLIPVITLVGGSLFASKSVYNSVAYQPIRTLVRRLEVYLNEIYYEAVTFDKEGHIYFLTEQLKMNVHVLTLDEQKLIAADIEALQTPSLDYVQKTNVVQRMYRTYPCLIPARV